MNSILRQELNNRQEDLDLIIDLTKFLDKQVGTSIEGKGESLSIDDHIIDILKSVIHMMNYNQVESTLTGGIEQIYDHFSDNNIGYSQLKESIQQKILSAVQKNDVNIYKAVTTNLDLNVPKASLKIKTLFNGNIDLSTFLEIKKNYGIIIQGARRGEIKGDLERLKDIRNDLSHGNKSFKEHGRKYTLDDFLEVSFSVSSYMDHTVSAFDNYINDKKYLS